MEQILSEIKQHIWTLKRYSSSRFSHTRTLTDQSFASFVTYLESYKLQNYVTGHVMAIQLTLSFKLIIEGHHDQENYA